MLTFRSAPHLLSGSRVGKTTQPHSTSKITDNHLNNNLNICVVYTLTDQHKNPHRK